MTDGPTRLVTVDPPAPSDRPTQTVPVPARPARPAPFTMTLSRGGDPVIPGYRILGRLGRGGMGVVYKAIHLPLNRPVAIKMLGGTAYEIGDETRARFRKEAEALASLRHPNIIPVYEVGEADGLPFFTMELVEGGDLAGRIRSHPPTPGEAARIATQLARAVQAAHEAGILHRDLKPSNVLLQRTEVRDQKSSSTTALCPLTTVLCPKIADFGLAKRFGTARGDDRTMTQAGDILGTPSYMAPEQAEGCGSQAVGPGADIYALGAILYEMLVGRPPFDGADPVHTVIQVLNEEPTPPARLATGVPRDLETICLKCLQKDPRKRYASAGQLAEDLERFLDGKPIVARPVSTAERVWKWARRHPSVACLLGTTFVAILAALVGTTTMWMRANDRARRETEARELADQRERKLEEAALETDFRLARGYMERGLAACQSDDVPRGLTLMSRSLEMTEELQTRAFGAARARVDQLEWVVRTNLAMWQSRLAIRPRGIFAHPKGGDKRWVLDIDLSPDGRRAVLASLDGYVRLIDAETSEEIGERLRLPGPVFAASFSPDSKLFVLGWFDENAKRSVIRVWDADGGGPVGPELELRHTTDVGPFSFSNTGFTSSGLLFVQTDERTIRFMRPDTAAEDAPAIRAEVPLTVCLPLPAGETMITAHVDGSLRRWDVRTGRETGQTTATDSFVFSLACTPDGRRVAVGHWRGTARVWDGATLQPAGPMVETIGVTAAGGIKRWQGFLRAVDLTPDGRTLVTGGGLVSNDHKLRGHMQSWDVETGAERYSFPHNLPVWGLAVGADGATFASACEDGGLRVWNAYDGSLLGRHGQRGNVAKVIIGRDGRSLLASDMGGDPAPLLADLGPPPQAAPALRLPGGIADLQYTSDGSRLIVSRKDGVVQTFDPATGRPDGPALLLQSSERRVKASADGRTIAVWQPPEHMRADLPFEVWDLDTGRLRFARSIPPVYAVNHLPDGSLVALPFYANVVTAFGPEGEARWTFRMSARAPDAEWPVTGDMSADGRLLVLGEINRKTYYVVDGKTGQPIGDPWELPGPAQSVTVHPDGQCVVFAFRQGFLQAYDVASRRRCGPAISWRGRNSSVRFSPDGRLLRVQSETDVDQIVALVDPTTGLAIGPDRVRPFDERHGSWAFHPSSHVLAGGDAMGAVRFWNLPAPETGRAAKIRCWVEMSSRTELVTEPTEILQYLDDRAVGERRKRLREVWGER